MFHYRIMLWVLSKLMAFEMQCLRSIANVYWTEEITNEEVIQILITQRNLITRLTQGQRRLMRHKCWFTDMYLSFVAYWTRTHTSHCPCKARKWCKCGTWLLMAPHLTLHLSNPIPWRISGRTHFHRHTTASIARLKIFATIFISKTLIIIISCLLPNAHVKSLPENEEYK